MRPWLRAGLLAACELLAAPPARASGTSGADFLQIPVGGRPAALGAAYTALAADAYAPVWNPSGLSALPATQAAAMHLDYGGALSYEFASVAHPLSSGGGLGASAQYMRPRELSGRDASGAETGGFSSYFGAYTLAYGRTVSGPLSLGASATLVDARLGGVAGRTAAAGLGALYRVGPRVSLGAAAANLGGRLRFLDDSQSLPDTYRAGVVFSPTAAWSLAAEGAYARAEASGGRVGAEWRPLPLVALRAGYRSDAQRDVPGVTGLTTGVGLTALGQRFDYAWAPMGQLGDLQYFSVLLTFGAPAPAAPAAAAAAEKSP